MTKDRFDIKSDLAGRPQAQQIEILWISGPTWHDAVRIAQVLGIDEAEVHRVVSKLGATK